MIVVDSNVIAYLHLPQGDQTAAARRVLQRDPLWAAPTLWRSEFRNVLATQMRLGLITLSGAVALLAEAEATMAAREHEVDSTLVLTLAARSGRTAYDCEFVALAQVLGIQLVTGDRRVVGSFPEVAVSISDFAA